jgi:anti-anti-sigma factor
VISGQVRYLTGSDMSSGGISAMVGVWTLFAPVALALLPLAPAGGSIMSADSTLVSRVYCHDNVPMLSLRPSRWAGATAVEVIGDVDLASAPVFTDLVDDITRDRLDRVVLDLARVTFFCAAGAVLHARDAIAAAGGELVLFDTADPAQRMTVPFPDFSAIDPRPAGPMRQTSAAGLGEAPDSTPAAPAVRPAARSGGPPVPPHLRFGRRVRVERHSSGRRQGTQGLC